MSDIPYNYRKYIDDVTKMTQRGAISSGEQQASPSSAGSRGLAKTMQFTNNPTQMQLGQEAIAESMVEIRSILNRIDGVNVPVQEGHYPHIKSFDKLYGINDMQQYKAMADDAQSMDMGEFMDTYSSVIDMAGDFWEDHQKTSESNEDVVNEDPNTLAKELASEIMKYVRKGFDHIPADALKAKAKEYLSSIKESAVQEDTDDTRMEDALIKKFGKDKAKVIMDYAYSQMTDSSEEIMKSHGLTFKGDTEDDKRWFQKYPWLAQLDNKPWMGRLFDIAGQGPDYGTPVKMDDAVREDDDESYGYEWKCSNCGTENEFEMTPQERAEYIKDWEADNQDLVADGETGLDALNNLLDTGAESGMHYGQKCIKCGTDATNPYQNEDELSRLKELSGIEENAKVNFSPEQIKQLMMWNKKYSVYSGKNGDELPSGLVKANTDSGITSDGYEENEVKQYEKMFGKEEFDWDDSQHGEFQEKSKITGGMMSDLEKIVGVGNADDEYTLAEIGEKILGSSFGDTYEEQYQPFPEGDEFDIAEDEDFEEVLGSLGFPEDETELFDAEYQGRKVPLNKPMRGDVKKFKVYVKDPSSGNVKKVNFGHGGTSAKRKTMRIRKSNPKARKSFRARHNCANPGPKTKARYWSCRKW